MAKRPAADVGLADRFHRNGRLHAGEDPDFFQRRLHGQGVHHGGQHAHVVGAGALHPGLGQGCAAEDVAAADHHAHLHAGADDLGDLLGDRGQGLGVDAEAVAADARLSRQLQEDAFVARMGFGHGRVPAPSGLMDATYTEGAAR